jgi:phosphoenolpyruvate carboxykinase (ATP)
VTGVPAEILNPQKSWKPGGADLKQEVTKLAKLFMENFKKYQNEAAQDVIKAGKYAQGPFCVGGNV